MPHGLFCVIVFENSVFPVFRRECARARLKGAGTTKGLHDMAKLGQFWFRLLAILLACAFETTQLTGDQVHVRHMEGLMHGFLALRTLDGKRLADGEMTQVAEGDRVTRR